MTLLKRLQAYKVQESSPQCPVAGKLTRVVGLTLEAIGCRAAVGSLCKIETLDGHLEAEVVGWGIGRESWGIRYQRIYGDLKRGQVWADLDEFLSRTWKKKDVNQFICNTFASHSYDVFQH